MIESYAAFLGDRNLMNLYTHRNEGDRSLSLNLWTLPDAALLDATSKPAFFCVCVAVLPWAFDVNGETLFFCT